MRMRLAIFRGDGEFIRQHLPQLGYGEGGDTSCYVNLQEKKKTLPLSSTSHRLLDFSLCMDPSIRTPHQRSQASRLNYLLFEVTAVATPHVAYAFVTKRCPALHTFNRAGRGAGTRRATKSQSSRCSYLSENASIRAERFRTHSDPFAAECVWPSDAADFDRDTSFQAAMPLASRGLVPRHRSPRHTWSLGENRRVSDQSDAEQLPQ